MCTLKFKPFLFALIIYFQLIGQCFGEFKFVFDQIGKCKALEEERKEFEMEHIELEGELEKCVLKKNIVGEMNEIERKLKNHFPHNFGELNEISEELKKMNLGKDLLKLLEENVSMEKAKINGENKNEIGSSSSGSGSGAGQPAEGKHLQQDENNHVHFLTELQGFRLNLNNEIKWLNVLIWLKKPKKYFEDLKERFENGEMDIRAKMDEYIEEQKKIKGGSVLTILANKKLAKAFKELISKQSKFVKDFDKIERELEATRKISTNYDWPLYEELLKKIKNGISKFMQIDLKDLKAKISADMNEQRAFNLLKETVKNWNPLLKNIIDEAKKILTKVPQVYEEELWNYVSMNQIASELLKTMMEFFEWDNIDEKMYKLYLLVKEIKPKFVTLSISNGKEGHMVKALKDKFKLTKIDDPLELAKGEMELANGEKLLLTDEKYDSITHQFPQIQTTIDSLKVLTFYEKLSELQSIKSNKLYEFEKAKITKKINTHKFSENLTTDEEELTKQLKEVTTEVRNILSIAEDKLASIILEIYSKK